MRKVFAAVVGVAALTMASAAWAGPYAKMVGKWTWEGFTVEAVEGGTHGLSAKVIAGPKNVGMEMMLSPLMPKDGAMVGRIRHPANGQEYNAKMTMPDDNSWAMDGCTDGGSCATGIFKRVQ